MRYSRVCGRNGSGTHRSDDEMGRTEGRVGEGDAAELAQTPPVPQRRHVSVVQRLQHTTREHRRKHVRVRQQHLRALFARRDEKAHNLRCEISPMSSAASEGPTVWKADARNCLIGTSERGGGRELL